MTLYGILVLKKEAAVFTAGQPPCIGDNYSTVAEAFFENENARDQQYDWYVAQDACKAGLLKAAKTQVEVN